MASRSIWQHFYQLFMQTLIFQSQHNKISFRRILSLLLLSIIAKILVFTSELQYIFLFIVSIIVTCELQMIFKLSLLFFYSETVCSGFCAVWDRIHILFATVSIHTYCKSRSVQGLKNCYFILCSQFCWYQISKSLRFYIKLPYFFNIINFISFCRPTIECGFMSCLS